METLDIENFKLELQEKFAELNKMCFCCKLPDTDILIIDPLGSRNIASYDPDDKIIKIHPDTLTGKHESINEYAPQEGRRRIIFDALLHEMIHKYCCEFLGVNKGEDPDHGPEFKTQCNRIADILGLEYPQDSLDIERFPLESRDYYMRAMKSKKDENDKDLARRQNKKRGKPNNEVKLPRSPTKPLECYDGGDTGE